MLQRFFGIWSKAHKAAVANIIVVLIAISMISGAWALAFKVASDVPAVFCFLLLVECGFAAVALIQEFVEDGFITIICLCVITGVAERLIAAVHANQLSLATAMTLLGIGIITGYGCLIYRKEPAQ